MFLAVSETGWQALQSRDVWLIGAFSLFVATMLGFLVGYGSAQLRERREQKRARKGLTRLFETARKSLDATLEVCGLLEKAPESALLPEEAESLSRRSQGLLESVSRIVKRHRPATVEEVAGGGKDLAKKPATEKLEWLDSDLNSVTGLPNAASFRSNLELLCDHARETEQIAGVLAVQIDKLASLRTRFGNAGADSLLKRLGFLVCRSVRDEDLVCQAGSDRIIVLLPGIESDEGAKVARAVREAIRDYQFRVDEHGPEVLVTASFGYVACQPDDHPEMVLDRAANALTKSQRLGRNQLHVHDGAAAVYCATAT